MPGWGTLPVLGAQQSPLTQPALVVLFQGTPETLGDSGPHREAVGAPERLAGTARALSPQGPDGAGAQRVSANLGGRRPPAGRRSQLPFLCPLGRDASGLLRRRHPKGCVLGSAQKRGARAQALGRPPPARSLGSCLAFSTDFPH